VEAQRQREADALLRAVRHEAIIQSHLARLRGRREERAEPKKPLTIVYNVDTDGKIDATQECRNCLDLVANCRAMPCKHCLTCLDCTAALIKSGRETCIYCQTPLLQYEILK
jgi:hypothetical protein